MTPTPITSPLTEADQQTTGAALQNSLVDLIGLGLIAKQAHWNVIGPDFRSVHLQLDELVTMARQYADEVAERAAAIGVSPDGRPGAVAKDTGIPEFTDGWRRDVDVKGAITKILGGLISRFRERIEKTDKSDLITQDILIELTAELEKSHWMWQAQLAK